MDKTNETTPVIVDVEAPILPVGYGEDVDIFSEEWLNAATAPVDGSADAQTENQTEATDESQEAVLGSANADELSGDGLKDAGDPLPATQEDAGQPKKLKFTTTVDHKDVEVELGEDDVPELYQKAQALDRTRKKLESFQSEMEYAEYAKELLGYKSVKEMLETAVNAATSAEQDKLIAEGVHPKVAEDMLKRKTAEIKSAAEKKRADAEAEAGEKKTGKSRDFQPEVRALLEVHPELRGQKLSDDVVRECLSTGKPLVEVYERSLYRQQKAENDKLRKQNQTLTQNAEAAKRAPVRGVAKSGSAEIAPDDPFLAGFNLGR